jgi:hypothetical protein
MSLVLSDTIWTINVNIRYRFLTPNSLWLVLQPGNEPHIVMFAVLSILFIPILCKLDYDGLFNVYVFSWGLAFYWVWHFAKVLVSPNPAWIDWGFLTMCYPQFQASVPEFAVFVMNDILDRIFFLAILIWSAFYG